MSYDMLTHFIAQFGYGALFFALWLGIVGMPIPDEVVVMTGGAISKAGLLHAVPAFLVTYLGVITGLSLGYVLGRLLGSTVLDKLRRKRNMGKHIAASERLINKYGNWALGFSYFIPVVRHIVPYFVGISKMPYYRYALFSYSAGLAWTLVFFMAGQFAGTQVERIGTLLYHYGLYAGAALLIGVIGYIVTKNRKRSKAEC